MTPPSRYYGIDVSKDQLHIAWQDGPQWHYQPLDNQTPTIAAWIESQPQQAHFVLEHTGTYAHRLVCALALAQRPFSLITPQQSKGFAQVVKTITKTDHQDAQRLALYGQRMQPASSDLTPEGLHQLRQCHKHLADLRVQQQAIANRLHALSYDPRASAKVVGSLTDSLQHYQAQIALFEDELDQMGQQELAQIARQMQRVSGIGPVASGVLASATNGLRGFESAKAVAKFIGIAPRISESGRSVRHPARMARTGRGYVRGILYMAARSARRHNLCCKALYERLRAKGKCHKVAMIAVINKLLHQVFAVVKKDVEFVNGFGLAKQNLA